MISLSYHVIHVPMESRIMHVFHFLTCINEHTINVHVNYDLYYEQMNHSVVIKLKINNFVLTFTSISPFFAAK